MGPIYKFKNSTFVAVVKININRAKYVYFFQLLTQCFRLAKRVRFLLFRIVDIVAYRFHIRVHD